MDNSAKPAEALLFTDGEAGSMSFSTLDKKVKAYARKQFKVAVEEVAVGGKFCRWTGCWGGCAPGEAGFAPRSMNL